MSAGFEFVGIDGWCRLPGWDGTTSHVPFETGGGKDKDQANAVSTDVLEAHPSLSGDQIDLQLHSDNLYEAIP